MHGQAHARTRTHTRAREVANTGPHCPLLSGNWLPKVFSIFTNKGSQAREEGKNSSMET